MAPDEEGLRRAVDSQLSRERLIDLLEVLSASPSPRGQERSTALRLARWVRTTWPRLTWSVEPVGRHGANLVGRSSLGPPGPELLFYSHLDTSLSGDPAADRAVTGQTGPPPALRLDAARGRVSGFGLGVARAPLAAAVLGYAAAATALTEAGAAHRLCLLLASAGTHRARWGGDALSAAPSGVRHHLATHPSPSAAVVAKCGPRGVLHEEPGAMYLRVRLGSAFGALLAPATLRPPGGILAHLAVPLAALADWRAEHLRTRAGRPGQIGREVGIGCVTAGSPGKPDLAPGAVEIYLYLVLLPVDDPSAITTSVRMHLQRALRGTPLDGVMVTVDGHLVDPAAATAPGARVVAAAEHAWRTVFDGPPPPVTSWTGSTDGVVFRAAGVDTARVGPAARAAADDPRADLFDLDELLRFARLYAALAVHYLGRPTTPAVALPWQHNEMRAR